MIADRTALENAPAADGSVFIVSNRKRDIELPGLKIRPRKGAGPLPEDLPFLGGLRLSSMGSSASLGRSRKHSGRADAQQRFYGFSRGR